VQREKKDKHMNTINEFDTVLFFSAYVYRFLAKLLARTLVLQRPHAEPHSTLTLASHNKSHATAINNSLTK